jgi:hypothetical protein
MSYTLLVGVELDSRRRSQGGLQDAVLRLVKNLVTMREAHSSHDRQRRMSRVEIDTIQDERSYSQRPTAASVQGMRTPGGGASAEDRLIADEQRTLIAYLLRERIAF